MKSHFCIPTRMRASRKSTGLSPMSLLDRFREAVFRLIMISALSKASTNNTYNSTYDSQSPIRLSSRSSSKSSPAATNRHHHHNHRSFHRYASDSHHTEAVADCIEFIKRSANDESRDSTVSCTSSSRRSPVYEKSSAENVITLPVM